MTEAKHTPGPWVAEEFTGRTTRLRVRTEDGFATICQVTALIHKQANARLIAAAPELLAALEGLMREFDLPTSCPERPGPAAAVDAAIAALSKAKG